MTLHAAWRDTFSSQRQQERGSIVHRPQLETDVTDFSKAFVKVSGGVPIHKFFPTEEVVLRDPKTRVICPPWKMLCILRHHLLDDRVSHRMVGSSHDLRQFL